MKAAFIQISFLLLVSQLIFPSCNKQFYQYDSAEILSNDKIDEILLVLEDEEFKRSLDKKDIPRFVLNNIRDWKPEYKLANPDEKYQVSDLRLKGLVPRRLIALFKNKKHLFIAYEHDGRGKHEHIMYFELINGMVNDFWVGSMCNLEDLNDLEKISSCLKTKINVKTNTLEF